VLCTDDKGVFCCSLSGEYAIAAESFGWTREELFAIAREAVEYTFATDQGHKVLHHFRIAAALSISGPINIWRAGGKSQ
jgi:adenosine deaminase